MFNDLIDTIGYLQQYDKELGDAMQSELARQKRNLELIASENIVSPAVMAAMGSVLTNKYAEGYPGKRYYGGCQYIDMVETLAIDYLKEIYGCKYANVQPHSGSSANMAVYRALLNHGDKVMGMNLSHGGHLTHGHSLSFSGQDYEIVSYDVDPVTEMINYDELAKLVLKEKPKMIIAGASAYSRIIDFKKFKEIAQSVGAYLMVDMAHIAGLVAASVHPNPVPYADVVTSTTHKTLRGPRGGIILTNSEEIIKKINKTIFPGIQGGPLEHIIAAKAVCFGEALLPEFKEYAQQIIKNAHALCVALIESGYKIVGGVTENHLMTVDLRDKGITGKDAANLLDEIGITVNKNTVPNDPQSPFVTSGLRIGVPAITTRGFKEIDCMRIGNLIAETIDNRNNPHKLNEIKQEVKALCDKYPLYEDLACLV